MAGSSEKFSLARLSKHSIADEMVIRGVILTRENLSIPEKLAKELARDLGEKIIVEAHRGKL